MEEAFKALLAVKEVIEKFGDKKVLNSYYLEFSRRAEVIDLVLRLVKKGSTIIDVGASPYILSQALAKIGYNVIAIDVEPERYLALLNRTQGVRRSILKLILFL
jgi:2-polyprenyl-3-methyl-5-hydroxy-6-metoxy-1,4-benzoquinol methylase